MPYTIDEFDKLILRDFLAIDRTKLANARTFLAYLRTGLMMVVSGITLLKLLPQFPILQYIGYALFPFAGVVFIFGIVQYFKQRGRIELEAEQIDKLKETESKE